MTGAQKRRNKLPARQLHMLNKAHSVTHSLGVGEWKKGLERRNLPSRLSVPPTDSLESGEMMYLVWDIFFHDILPQKTSWCRTIGWPEMKG